MTFTARLSAANRFKRVRFELLEGRSLLAADLFTPALMSSISDVEGDANLDGVFNSADLVQVFQAGKYETSESANWTEGDWDSDGRFDSQDLIAAFQAGTYVGNGASAVATVPLKGRIDAVETSVAEFPTLMVDASGGGNATHLGKFTVDYAFQVDLVTFVGTGSAHFLAANGDSIFTEIYGEGTVPDPISSIVETHTITGGTGRFAGATGTFIVSRTLDTSTGVSFGTFDGSIVLANT